jgi:hypothetical protein
MMREKPRKFYARSDVGVRNPFPLAEAILMRKRIVKGPINWRELPAEKAKSYLSKAFGIPYNHLFDPNPEYHSPLYRRLSRRGKTGNPSSDSERDYILSRRTEAISGASPCTGSVAKWFRDPNWTYPPPPPPSGGLYGIDTLQGCVGDCYFIAALTAIGWTSPGSLTGGNDTDPNCPDNNLYSFHASSTSSPTSVSVAKPLCVDTNSNLVFARPANQKDVWPSLYEKAYAVFRGQPRDKPDISTLDSGNPVTALCEISGKFSDGKLLKSTAYYPPTTANLLKLFKDIGAKCAIGAAGGRTKYPMVAWTYHDSTQTPSGDSYTDDLIVANHSYAILGTTITSSWGNCVVLRNPYGHSLVTQPKPGIHDCQPWGGSLSFKIAEGNFAMEMAAFARYFEGFGFTV